MHPIHMKGKPHTPAGNYRGITIINIICKILDIIHANHQRAAIPHDKCPLQFSFTQERSPTQASVLLSEILAEAKDGKKILLVASVDIMKAFDIISHAHLLRKLYLAGLPGRWWIMKENSCTNMTSRVVWDGQLGEKFTVTQGNGQGRTASPDDFKEYINEHIDTMKSAGHGTHIGSIFTGMIACADDTLLTSWSMKDMLIQMGLSNHLNNEDRLQINSQKTSISAYGLSKTELDHLRTEQPWVINGEHIPVGTNFTHIGIDWELTSFQATTTATIDSRLRLGRCTTYAIMGAGLHGTDCI
jgi:hypothetical protein